MVQLWSVFGEESSRGEGGCGAKALSLQVRCLVLKGGDRKLPSEGMPITIKNDTVVVKSKCDGNMDQKYHQCFQSLIAEKWRIKQK